MGELIAERTNNELRVDVYPGGQLGSERDTLEITIFGGLHMNRVNATPLNAIAPLTIVPCLPFLFESTSHMRLALDSAPGQKVLDSLEDAGLIGLCFYDSGARSFYTTDKPIVTPDDLQGQKIRVMNSDLAVGMMNALGADATPMSLADVYQALVQGVIDGAENNWPSYEQGGHFEVARYYSLTQHVMTPEILVMSARKWRELPEEHQQIVKQAARESVPVMRGLWDKSVSAAQSHLREGGTTITDIPDKSLFSDRMKPVWEQFAITAEQQGLIEEIQGYAQAARSLNSNSERPTAEDSALERADG